MQKGSKKLSFFSILPYNKRTTPFQIIFNETDQGISLMSYFHLHTAICLRARTDSFMAEQS